MLHAVRTEPSLEEIDDAAMFELAGLNLVAPDLPGFGQSDMPRREAFSYTFDDVARVIDRFTEVIGFDRFAIYVFDYGAPTGFRLAARHPERITAIISQNGNAYEEGLSEGWSPIKAYWQDPVAGEPKRAPRLPCSGDDPLAVHAWRSRSDHRIAGWPESRQLLFGATRR
jgi:pimeloyl-ACP methyl ester carboxylesterase